METLDGLAAGTIEERPQDDAEATYAPKLKSEDRVIDWSRPAEEIVRLVRAMAPEPGAATIFRGRGLKVLRASWRFYSHPVHHSPVPGTIMVASKEGLAVVSGGVMVLLHEVQPEGRKRMSGADFVRGYRPEPGERLGEPAGGTPARG